jgi:3-isopropylmalate/(R)-2-methylmalate dehydratase large subunit
VLPDEDAHYEGGVHTINLDEILPMIANPGDPTNGVYISEIEDVPIDIAYAGSCTAGKVDDFQYYIEVVEAALKAGIRIPKGVECFIQFGSKAVKDYSEKMGWNQMFREVGIQLIDPGCGACIGAGPGVSDNSEEVTISAINRNFQGRSGPGKLYLASPLTVMASAFSGKIMAWEKSLFTDIN